jgi:hypothetical protein
MEQIRLCYLDPRVSEEEVLEYCQLAWDDIYELEYEYVFGGWRGVHLDVDNNVVHITWDNAHSGPPLMSSICRLTKTVRIRYPQDEFMEIEEAAIEKIRNAPPGMNRK